MATTIAKKSTKPVVKKSPAKKVIKSATKKVSKTTTKTTSKKFTKPKAAKPEAASNMLAVGDRMPNYTGPSDTQGIVSLRNFEGEKNVVLYFYPKDNTPGCTVEACAFQAAHSKFAKNDTVIIGVSPDSLRSHAKFREKFGLQFILIADEDHKLAEACGAWAMKSMYGRSYMGVVRSTFVFNKKGVATHVWPKVTVKGHDEEVLEAIKSL